MQKAPVREFEPGLFMLNIVSLTVDGLHARKFLAFHILQ
jgi:hypothetical protein